jgi:hypothetical protein
MNNVITTTTTTTTTPPPPPPPTTTTTTTTTTYLDTPVIYVPDLAPILAAHETSKIETFTVSPCILIH